MLKGYWTKYDSEILKESIKEFWEKYIGVAHNCPEEILGEISEVCLNWKQYSNIDVHYVISSNDRLKNRILGVAKYGRRYYWFDVSVGREIVVNHWCLN